MSVKQVIPFEIAEVAPLSYEEAQLFIAGIAAKETLNLPLTPRVEELLKVVRTDNEFKGLVLKAIQEFKDENALSNALLERINQGLHLEG